MARVEFVREYEDDDSSYDTVFIDGTRRGLREQMLEEDYFDALGISYEVIITN